MDGTNVTTYSITKGAPLSATVVTEQSASLSGDGFDVRVETRGVMTGDETNFLVTFGLDAYEQDRRVASRQWLFKLPRVGN